LVDMLGEAGAAQPTDSSNNKTINIFMIFLPNLMIF